ncbi:hypothetical protein E2C01_016412 [Portunus trituberculatus]|uniref:Uncharacterized protein n=1 Tax=Portunus trituberculatus TaxID=210409 RepID=A0A5B7DPI6_PORTR|nr:hypothetical protein [Portunus trituberculatus]
MQHTYFPSNCSQVTEKRRGISYLYIEFGRSSPISDPALWLFPGKKVRVWMGLEDVEGCASLPGIQHLSLTPLGFVTGEELQSTYKVTVPFPRCGRTLLWSANNNNRGQQIARSTGRSAECMLGHHAASVPQECCLQLFG